jgi:hypothetical protein
MEQEVLNFLHITPTKKAKISVLHEISGVIKPSRYSLFKI